MDRPYWVFGCKVTAFGYVHARRFLIPSAIWFAQFFCCCCCCSLTNYFPFVFFTFLHLFIITFLFYLSCERNNQIRFLKVARIVHHCQVLHSSWHLFLSLERNILGKLPLTASHLVRLTFSHIFHQCRHLQSEPNFLSTLWQQTGPILPPLEPLIESHTSI